MPVFRPKNQQASVFAAYLMAYAAPTQAQFFENKNRKVIFWHCGARSHDPNFGNSIFLGIERTNARASSKD